MDQHTEARPWGSFTVLCEGPGYKVKKVSVSPRQRLSYQFHHHRQEHWLVVEGVATITLEGEVHVLEVGQTIDIPLGAKHRIANTGAIPMTIIEIQRGDYVGEDDIVRIEDDFGRS